MDRVVRQPFAEYVHWEPERRRELWRPETFTSSGFSASVRSLHRIFEVSFSACKLRWKICILLYILSVLKYKHCFKMNPSVQLLFLSTNLLCLIAVLWRCAVFIGPRTPVREGALQWAPWSGMIYLLGCIVACKRWLQFSRLGSQEFPSPLWSLHGLLAILTNH